MRVHEGRSMNTTLDITVPATSLPSAADTPPSPLSTGRDAADPDTRARQRAARRQRLAATPRSATRAWFDTDWEQIRSDRRSIELARSWRVTHCHINDLDDLVTAAGYDESGRTSSTTGTEAEQVLWRLIDVARTDDLAARIVMRRIMPGLLAAIRRRPRTVSSGRAANDIMAGAWIAVRTFDMGRHPSCLAAALISDAVYRAFHAENRRQVQRETVVDDIGERAQPMDVHDLSMVRDILIEARAAGMDPVDLEVVRRVIVGGSTDAIANDLGVTARAVRYRCSRVVAELASFASVDGLRPAG